MRGCSPSPSGGGHDLTFPFVRAVSDSVRTKDAGASLAGVYFDAHLDVRETAGSGMPFRRLIEDCRVSPLLLAGFNPLVNSREHVDWFLENGGEIADADWMFDLDHSGDDDTPPLLGPLEGTDNIFCSFDLDVLDGACAPGVSAVNPAGISVQDAARAVFLVAGDPRLRCLDFMELCPPHDDQRPPGEVAGRTARVAAHLFLHALMGLAMGPLSGGAAGGRD